MSSPELKASARQSLQGKWGKGALIILSYLGIILLINLVLGIIPVIGQIVNAVITIPISYGIMVSFIKLKRGEEVKYTDFLNEGLSKIGKVWGIVGHTILKMLIPVIVVVVSYFIVIFGTSGTVMNAFTEASLGFLGITVIGIIVFMISGIYVSIKGLLYILTNYILYDNPDMDSKAIVEESERLMRGNRCKYVWLELTFIGWFILTSFTFGIGLLWLAPYMSVTVICFYEALSGKNSNIEAEVIEDINPIL